MLGLSICILNINGCGYFTALYKEIYILEALICKL